MKPSMLVAAFAAMTLPLTAAAQAVHTNQQPGPGMTRAEVAITYSTVDTNAPVGDCGCFWVQGGSIQAAVPVWKYVSGVGEFSGEATGKIPGFGVGLTLLSGTGGIKVGTTVHTRFAPFAEGLFGVVHASDSYFAHPVAPKTTATAFDMTVGGGVDLTLSRHFAARLIQADYQYMQLPNNDQNEQHDLRLSAGIVYRFTR